MGRCDRSRHGDLFEKAKDGYIDNSRHELRRESRAAILVTSTFLSRNSLAANNRSSHLKKIASAEEKKKRPLDLAGKPIVVEALVQPLGCVLVRVRRFDINAATTSAYMVKMRWCSVQILWFQWRRTSLRPDELAFAFAAGAGGITPTGCSRTSKFLHRIF